MRIGMTNLLVHCRRSSRRRVWVSALAAALLLVLSAPYGRSQEQDQKVTDQKQDQKVTDQKQDQKVTDEKITHATTVRLKRVGGMDADKIVVDTKEGAMTLSGTVPTLEAKERAVSLAQGIRGVTSVEDRIKVQPAERTDEQIRTDIQAALGANSALRGADRGIQVEVKEGVVTLTGETPSQHISDLAKESIKGIRGVREIHNEIRTSEQARRADDEIGTQILRRLTSDSGLWGSNVRAVVRDGIVTLSGTVGSAAARARAIRDAHVAGVRSVDARGLEVRWRREGESARATTPTVARTDEQTREAVKEALQYEPWLHGTQPQVAAQDGAITLTGEVSSLRAKQAAERAARDVAGVRQVRNELQVKGGGEAPAEQIAQNVASALERDAYLGDDKIAVTATATHGTVQLRGDVDSAFEAARAAQLASGIAGVGAIQNELTANGQAVEHPKSWFSAYYHPYARVAPALGTRTQPKNDTEIKNDIEDELFWSPFVDRDEVRVAVKDGVATLTGTVDTWGEHGAAIENAYEGGARSVQDHLQVRQGPENPKP